MTRRNLFAFALLACATAAWATTVIPMSIEDLTRAASNIIEARAVSSRSAWNAQHSLIYTYTTYQVTRTLKGNAADTIVVKQLGGSAGGYTQKVAGVHHAQPGENALLFLRPSAGGDATYVVVGLIQGNFRVFQDAAGQTRVSNGVTGAQQWERGAGRISQFNGASMTIDAAEARIRRALP